MNFGILLFVIALFCHSCVSSNPSFKKFPDAECINSVTYDSFSKIKLPDLIADVLVYIYDELDLVDMVHLLEAYPAPTLASATKMSFWKRFRDYEVFIDHKSHSKQISVNEKLKRVVVHSEKMGSNALRIFGDSIQRLNVPFPSSPLIKSIDEYIRDSLIELNLIIDDFENGDTFQILNKPFLQVKKLSLSILGELKTGDLTFVQIFPNVHQLKLDLNSYLGDYEFFFGEFPHLNTLELYLYTGDTDEYAKFEGMLRSSYDIRSLSINELSHEFSNVINEHAPNLETLSVSSIHIANETRFENVKQLEILSYSSEVMDAISFPQLQSIVVNYPNAQLRENDIQPLIRFLGKHTNVSQLHLSTLAYFNLVMQMIELQHVRELTLEYKDRLIQDIPLILQRHPNLMILNIVKFGLLDTQITFLESIYENAWNIVKNHEDEVVAFERIV